MIHLVAIFCDQSKSKDPCTRSQKCLYAFLFNFLSFLSKMLATYAKTQKIEPDPDNIFMTAESFEGSV